MHLFLWTLRLLTEKKRWGYKGFWCTDRGWDHIWCLRHSSAQRLVALIKLSHALTYGRIVWKWFMIVSSVYQSVAIACSKATTRTWWCLWTCIWRRLCVSSIVLFSVYIYSFIFSFISVTYHCCCCLSPYSYWHVDAHLFAAYHAWRASSSSHKIG